MFSACDSDLALWALEARKVHGRPFLDIACTSCGAQRLRPPHAFSQATHVLSLQPLRIVIWGFLTDGPYGGGAHFLQALAKAFKRMGHEVRPPLI